MANVFPTDIKDNRTKKIVDKYNKVLPKEVYPKMIPYTDKSGNKVSPLTDFMYYHKLPEVYRVFDAPLGNPLYRYLQAILEGGYANLVFSDVKGNRGIENLLQLIDPRICPDELLPLYYESLGIQWFQDLITEKRGTYYLRTFLCNIGEILRRRGTESLVKYIAKVLTEMDVYLRYQRYNKDGVTEARVLWVEMQANTPEEISAVEVNAQVIKRFIDTQIPYYITSIVTYVLKRESETAYYTGSFTTKRVSQKIMPASGVSRFKTKDQNYFKTSDGNYFSVNEFGNWS